MDIFEIKERRKALSLIIRATVFSFAIASIILIFGIRANNHFLTIDFIPNVIELITLSVFISISTLGYLASLIFKNNPIEFKYYVIYYIVGSSFLIGMQYSETISFLAIIIIFLVIRFAEFCMK